MIGQVQEDGTLICQADTDLSIVPTYRRVPSSRFEAESTTVVNADGEVINGNIVQDELASGGAYMGSTGGKGFILESTTQANRISVAYASPNTATILVYLLQGRWELRIDRRHQLLDHAGLVHGLPEDCPVPMHSIFQRVLQ